MTRPRSDLFGALGAGALVVLFCFVLLWHDPLLFWNDDYELSILPVFADMARSWSEGQLPLLSPYSWVCGNLAGEFQYGTFSIFINAAVVTIWKFPLAFAQQAAALSITHLFALGMGGYMLARGRNLASPLALVVALVAALNGWIICWGATDWFGALGAFAWIPWAWWGLERAIDPQRGKWRFVWPAPFAYLVITGGFPYTVLMLALLIGWIAVRTIVETRRLWLAWPIIAGVALGVGMSAPAWLALLDYLHGSAREAQDASAHLQWRVPLQALPALLLPNWTVNWTDFSTRLMPHTATEMAGGLVPPAVLLAGVLLSPRALVRRVGWEVGLLAIVLVLCMVPMAGVFRWSFRWLPLLHLVAALSAAEALAGASDNLRRRFAAVAVSAVVVTAGVMFLAGIGGRFAFPLTWILLLIAAAWLLGESFAGELLRRWLPAAITFTALLAVYLCIPANCGVPKYNLGSQLRQPAPLDRARLYLSVYPFPEFTYRMESNPGPVGVVVRPGSTSMFGAVRLINGYSPIRPAGVARTFNTGIHGQIDYTIATQLLRKEAGPHAELAQLGVDGIIVAQQFDVRPEPASEWRIVYTSDEGTVYHRIGQPLAAVRSVIAAAAGTPSTAAVHLIQESRTQVVADVAVPAAGSATRLVFSRPFFRGYTAALNNQRIPVSSLRGLAPSVELPPGSRGELKLTYRPEWLTFGGAAAIICLIVVIGASILGWRERRA